MVKKLISLILLVFLFGAFVGNTYGLYEDADAEFYLLSAEEQLLKIEKGDIYKTQIDTLVEVASQKQLEIIEEKITEAYGRLMEYNGAQYEDISAILGYFDLKTYYALEEKKYSEILDENISAEAKKIAEKEILIAQKQLQSHLKNSLKTFMGEWQEIQNISETGNLDVNINLNIGDTFHSENSIQLSDYSSETHEFDQKLQGYFKAFSSTSYDNTNIHVEIQSFLDFIAKDGNMYLLLKELKMEDLSTNPEATAFLKSYVEKLQELSKDDIYVSYIDQGSEAIITAMNSFQQPSEMLSIFDTALFEAVEKNEETYTLRPTQAFCNSMKKISGIFDPFRGEDCSQSQYKDMLLEMREKNVNIYFTPGENNEIILSIANETVLGNIYIVWNDDTLLKISGNIVEPENESINNISFSFIPNKEFISDILIEGSITNIKASLTNLGTVQRFQLTSRYKDIFQAKMNYFGEKLTGDLTLKDTNIDISCSMKGVLREKYMNVDSQCTLDSSALINIMSENTASFSQKIFVDMMGEKNNVEYIFHGKAGEKNNLDIKLKNTGIRTKIENQNITAPEKTKAFSEIQDEIYNELWGDYDYYNDEDFNYDPYSIYNEEEHIYYYCNVYEYNEADNYETCTEYLPETEYNNSYDPSSIYNEEEDMYYYCNTYEYDEITDYETCTDYISETEYDELYPYDEDIEY